MLKCLRVTEVIGCKRALWYNNAGYDRDLPHPLGLAGTELHKAIQNNLENNIQPKFKFEDNIRKFDNYLLMKDVLKIDFLTLEKRYYSTKHKLPFSGKPDVIKGSIIFDWKGGKLHRTEHELQLTAYYLLLKENNVDIEKFCIVYLGNPYPVEMWFKPHERNIKIFLKEYELCHEVLALPKAPYSDLIEHADFGCLFCSWFTQCKKDYLK